MGIGTVREFEASINESDRLESKEQHRHRSFSFTGFFTIAPLGPGRRDDRRLRRRKIVRLNSPRSVQIYECRAGEYRVAAGCGLGE